MRDGSTRRPATSPRHATWTPDRVQVQRLATTRAASRTSCTCRTARAASPGRDGCCTRCSKNSTSATTSTCSSVRAVAPARQPVPTAARHRARCCDTAGRPHDLARTGHATRALASASRAAELNTYGCDCSPRRRGTTRAPLSGPRTALKGVMHMLNESSSHFSIHTRSPRAGTRLRLPAAARQRRTRRRRARRWC